MRSGRLIDYWPVKPKPSSEGEFGVVGDALIQRQRQNLSTRESGGMFFVLPANLSQVCRQPMRASAKSAAFVPKPRHPLGLMALGRVGAKDTKSAMRYQRASVMRFQGLGTHVAVTVHWVAALSTASNTTATSAAARPCNATPISIDCSSEAAFIFDEPR